MYILCTYYVHGCPKNMFICMHTEQILDAFFKGIEEKEKLKKTLIAETVS